MCSGCVTPPHDGVSPRWGLLPQILCFPSAAALGYILPPFWGSFREKRRLGVGERFVETGDGFRQFAGFQDGATVKALHVFRVSVLGNDLRAGMATSGGIVHGSTRNLTKSYHAGRAAARASIAIAHQKPGT
jgi:hypothetical protein